MVNKIKKDKVTITARWPRLLCVEDAAEYLNISPKTIRNGLARNALNRPGFDGGSIV
jgi:hypothetical protein